MGERKGEEMKLEFYCPKCDASLKAAVYMKHQDPVIEGDDILYIAVSSCPHCLKRWEKDIRLDERECLADEHDEAYRQ